MPFIHHTPEALIARSDSKNPAATCRGLTSAGRPCRRSIARSSIFSRVEKSSHDPEAYCWQHRDQTAAPPQALPQGLQSMTIKERTSVDTLIERLGLMDVQDQDERSRQRVVNVPPKFRHNANDLQPTMAQLHRRTKSYGQSGKSKTSRSNLSLFCCIGVAEDVPSTPRPVRVQPKQSNSARKSKHSTGESMQEINPRQHRPRIPSTKPAYPSQNTPNIPNTPNPQQSSQSRPSLSYSSSPKTGELLSFLPDTATPQTASLLLAELAKPLSTHDEEGYIYIFWLTPTSLSAIPTSEAVSSLLSPPSSRPAQGRRRTSEILESFSHMSEHSGSKDRSKSILLKIGRASNVHRRLNEWTRQCGHDLSLIRYYPYNPSSSPPAGSPNNTNPSQYFPNGVGTPTKVPHVHKIERLIHIELAEQRAKESGRCVSCGTAHREWFEVEASKEGIRAVDEIVRRWVAWGIQHRS